MTLCHVTLATDWDAAQPTGVYDRSTLRQSLDEVGFIHASDSYEQAARVVRYLFEGEPGPFVLLDLDRERLAQAGLRVVPEPIDPTDPHSEKFPHVYGGPIPLDAISRTQRFDTADDLLRLLDAD